MSRELDMYKQFMHFGETERATVMLVSVVEKMQKQIDSLQQQVNELKESK